MSKMTPQIRFQGFTDDWEERKLGEIFNYEQPTKYIVKSTEYDDTFNTPVLTAGKSFLLGYTDEITGIKNATVDNPVVIFDDFTTGSHYVDFPFKIKSSAMKLLSLNDNSDNFYFMFNTLKNIKYVPQSHERHWISKFSEFEIYKPSQEEQQKIGSFFKQLDNTIALHQRKLDLLKEQKKGFLQKMFPKNGAKIPELRFAGFADDWEERKFFESMASTIDFRGRTPKKLGMDWSESGYLALSALNVKNGYIDPLADAHYGDENLYKKWMSGKELKKGQVLFTTEAPMGNVAQVPDNNGYILSQRTVAFETKEDMMTNDFLAVLLKSPLVSNNLSALSSGGTAKGVSQKSLKGLSITVPFDIDEQQKIGSFFKQLDDTIALHQRKLDLLKEQKKGFLQKMFVS
ncbi:restriction endonuclease subunit S [Leuconostoc carnosum]|uniref:restriction endonuclease subunit S n=1 Tax=Leuconostoc carnosum TaxID=1252 RepID=UPI00123AF4F0|nr:restriction endonuclease subunit S [Leuconostoc carnosum]KAA8372612.1 restriction endonuclease subunit S [Leuconostoc carnosum]